MVLIPLNRPGLIVRNVIEEHRRVQKHFADNIDRINQRFTVVEFDAVHGMEMDISSPFGDRWAPSGVQLLNAVLSDGSPALPGTITMRPQRIAENGKLGVTVQFAPPYGRIDLAKSANQVGLLSGSTTDVTWDVENTKVGAISHASGSVSITCASAGFVRVSWQLAFAPGGTAALGSFVGGYVQKNTLAATGSRFGESRPQASCTSEMVSGSDDVPVAAGDTLKVQARHINSTGTARDLNGNQSFECTFKAAYVAPPVGYAARVTAMFYAP